MRSIAWLLILLGSAAAAVGLLMAVFEFKEIYAEALSDPMGEASPEPQERAQSMLTYVLIALPGVALSFLGFVLLLKARLARSRSVQQSRT